uniref:Uncharacterized protein n=1 Tax=Toxoplasma gondii COUG TaxID=1074873 RepID=A0A2G8YAI0_TOXGO|nr:hypothetical protein TGCOUG_366550 [Toxoplasma gondii COUG]
MSIYSFCASVEGHKEGFSTSAYATSLPCSSPSFSSSFSRTSSLPDSFSSPSGRSSCSSPPRSLSPEPNPAPVPESPVRCVGARPRVELLPRPPRGLPRFRPVHRLDLWLPPRPSAFLAVSKAMPSVLPSRRSSPSSFSQHTLRPSSPSSPGKTKASPFFSRLRDRCDACPRPGRPPALNRVGGRPIR